MNVLLKHFSLLSGFLFFITFVVTLEAAGQQTGNLSGFVIDVDTQTPIANAQVRLRHTTYVTSTNEDGAFYLPGILPGIYSVDIVASGYTTESFTDFQISIRQSRTLKTTLNPGNGSAPAVFFPDEEKILHIGAQHVVSVANLGKSPIRGPAAFGRTRAGVATFDGFDELYIRGTRADQVDYFLDGVRIEGDAFRYIPEAALEQITFESGHIDAAYGDLLSGVVHMSTRAGNAPYYGSLETLTSESLDPFGYTVFSGVLGGSMLDSRLSVMAAGEFNDQFDSAPSAIGQLQLLPEVLDDLRFSPMALRASTFEGDGVFLPLPATLGDGARLEVTDDGLPLLFDDQLMFSDGTRIAAAGVDPATIVLNPVIRANYLTPDQFTIKSAKLGRQQTTQSFLGTLAYQLFPSTTLRLRGRHYSIDRDDQVANLNQQVIFAPEIIPTVEKRDNQFSLSISQHTGEATFFHVVADLWRNKRKQFDRRFGSDWDALLDYGNIDSPVFDALRGYKDVVFENEIRVDDHGTPNDPSDDTEFTIRIPSFRNSFRDGFGPSTTDDLVANLTQIPGGRFNSYEQSESSRLHFGGYMQTKQGNHTLEAGFSYEKRTHRFWQLNAPLLSRIVQDPTLPPQNNAYPFYSSVPDNVLNTAVGVYYGYDITGTTKSRY